MSPMIRGEKQGHKCCGSCCDVRRAVIVVNIVNIVNMLWVIFAMIVFQKTASTMTYDDDTQQAAIDVVANMPLGLMIAIWLVSAVFSAVGIAGALLYNKWLVGVSGVFFCLSMIPDIMALNIPGIVYKGFFAYPHYFLVKEINQGIMTKENYPNEKMSCCCV